MEYYFDVFNLRPFDIYNGLSKVYSIKRTVWDKGLKHKWVNEYNVQVITNIGIVVLKNGLDWRRMLRMDVFSIQFQSNILSKV